MIFNFKVNWILFYVNMGKTSQVFLCIYAKEVKAVSQRVFAHPCSSNSTNNNSQEMGATQESSDR